MCLIFFFFFKQKTAYEMRISDWTSDVCSSDLDVPLLGHVLAVVAHALAGARLGDAGELGLEFAEVEALERGQPVARCLAARGLQQAPAQLLAVDDRHVGGGVRAAADAGVDLAGGDLVAAGDQRVERGAAGALQDRESTRMNSSH